MDKKSLGESGYPDRVDLQNMIWSAGSCYLFQTVTAISSLQFVAAENSLRFNYSHAFYLSKRVLANDSLIANSK